MACDRVPAGQQCPAQTAARRLVTCPVSSAMRSKSFDVQVKSARGEALRTLAVDRAGLRHSRTGCGRTRTIHGMATMNVSVARDKLPEAVELARTEALFLERYRRPAAVLVSPEHYEMAPQQQRGEADGQDPLAELPPLLARPSPRPAQQPRRRRRATDVPVGADVGPAHHRRPEDHGGAEVDCGQSVRGGGAGALAEVGEGDGQQGEVDQRHARQQPRAEPAPVQDAAGEQAGHEHDPEADLAGGDGSDHVRLLWWPGGVTRWWHAVADAPTAVAACRGWRCWHSCRCRA